MIFERLFEIILNLFKLKRYKFDEVSDKEKNRMKELNIEDKILTINEFSHSGEKIKAVKAIVLHWTGAPKQEALVTWQFFENRKLGKDSYGSAHYIVGQAGEIIHCIPDDEQSYHSGSSVADPVSGKMYTDECRRRFGTKPNGDGYSPNPWTIGIEMAVCDNDGNFNSATLESTEDLVVSLLKKFNLGIDAVTTHHNLVGWKDCPRLWTKNPELFEEFKQRVQKKLDIVNC